MKKFALLLIITVVLFTTTFSALAADSSSNDLDKPFNASTTTQLAQAVMKLGIAMCVIAACIYIAIGSFYYFAASGNASLAGKGKEIIQRSLIGLVLALISWIILNTIHPQFAENLKNPSFENSGQSQ